MDMKYLMLVLKGMAYGTTHIIPGLGGGLILILMGIYGQFVDVLGNLLMQRHRWREFLAFLVPLGIGMVIGMVALSKIITIVLDRYPAVTMFFFMGLLVGTIPPVLRMHSDMRFTASRGLAFLAGLIVVAGFRLLNPSPGAGRVLAGLGDYLYNLLVCFIAGGASVTPGLDGSYVLLLGGTYASVIEAFGMLAHLVIRWGMLISTGIGAVLGILVFSKLIDTALKRAPALAYYCILGLIVGSVYGLWPEEPAQVGIVILVLAFAAGVALALAFGREPETPQPEPDQVATGVA
ncbi:MAG: DUF368 domain-containing protein [Chloroflexi bacterium]|nr:DUF368 domain-containing protein [Chloroflexota bacterium]